MLMTGPLAPLGTAMAEQLVALGYTQRTATEHMRLVGKLSRFMQQRGLEVCDLSLDVVEQFLGTVRTTSAFASYGEDVVVVAGPPDPDWDGAGADRVAAGVVGG